MIARSSAVPVPHRLLLLAWVALLPSCRLLRKDAGNAMILQDASANYAYGPEREPVRITDPQHPGTTTPDGSVPHMTIATAQRRARAPVTTDRILARITSAGDYPNMGIRTGANYIWRDSRDSLTAASWTSKVIPTAPGFAAHTLTRDARLHAYTTGDPTEPRLVWITVHSMLIGVCLDDPKCGGHCGYY